MIEEFSTTLLQTYSTLISCCIKSTLVSSDFPCSARFPSVCELSDLCD